MSDNGIINSLTIDVEDYFQVSNFADFIAYEQWDDFPARVDSSSLRLLDILQRFSCKATFFILGWVAQRHPALVKEIARQGHEIACHSYAHQLVYDLDRDRFRQDLKRAKAILEDLSGQPVLGYRAPSYSIVERSRWALEILAEEGFSYDSSIYPVRHPRYGIPGAPARHHIIELGKNIRIQEFPPATLPLGKWQLPIGGGGYFRLLPYALTRQGLRRVNRQGQWFVFYLHPWEIDPQQPRFRQARLSSRFRHYINLERTQSRLERLLQDFRFAPLHTFLS